ncbi:SH3 domain-containing protein 1-like [Hibiscus syriacus]|uniref:SH3 domain-containing protein 1-like n=1 Tax=Hibiscus syriacus TaxID=106335 RepID=UPI001921357F|nr:SH3 domain-containing protein 1-like [Hibiscus syriacus]
MTLEEQKNESLNSATSEREVNVSIAHDNISSNRSEAQGNKQSDVYFIAKVVHPFDAEADGELSLAVGDYVVVRQVGPRVGGRKENARARLDGSPLLM